MSTIEQSDDMQHDTQHHDARPDDAPIPGGEFDVAVIGMAGRFPGADDLDTFWDNLRAGRESITFFTDDELRATGHPDELIATFPPPDRCFGLAEHSSLARLRTDPQP